MTLTFNDIKNDVPKVIDYLEQTFFSDSTVTMMNDEYLKSAISDRLSQVVLKQEGLAILNMNASDLSKAMLRSSLAQEDINLILNASLKISDLQVSVKSAAELEEEDGKKKKEKEEETPDAANAMIKAKMETMGSIENLIGIIKDNLGTSRITPEASVESEMKAFEYNHTVAGPGVPEIEPVKDMIYIERPLELNLDFVDLSRITNAQIFEFLNGLMAADSNSSLGVTLPIDAFTTPVREFLLTDLTAVLDAAIVHAKNSSKNSISFTHAPDPFQQLFETL